VNAVGRASSIRPCTTITQRIFSRRCSRWEDLRREDIVDAIVLSDGTGQVTGKVLHVDGGAHVGKW